ncbi:MAG: hypothetical protein ACTSQU_17040 [Promethearchaeota archaeon]
MIRNIVLLIEIIRCEDNGFDVVKNFEITNDQLKKEIGNYDGIVVRSRTKLTADVLENAKNLKVIGRAGVGLDNVDRKKAAELNIAFCFCRRVSIRSDAHFGSTHLACRSNHAS